MRNITMFLTVVDSKLLAHIEWYSMFGNFTTKKRHGFVSSSINNL